MSDVPLSAQIACVRREIMRQAEAIEAIYHRDTYLGEQASRDLHVMNAVLDTLLSLAQRRNAGDDRPGAPQLPDATRRDCPL